MVRDWILFVILIICISSPRLLGQTEDIKQLRRELIQEIDKRLKKTREQLIETIDKKLGLQEVNYLGAVVKTISPSIRILLNLPHNKGIAVSKVIPASPAERAGLQSMDVIIFFAGKDIATVAQFHQLISHSPPGTPLKIIALRQGKQLQLEVILEKKPQYSLPPEKDENDNELKELLKRLPCLKERVGEEIRGLEKFLRDAENQKVLQEIIKSGQEYLESIKKSPALSPKIKAKIESLVKKLRKKGKLPDEVEELLKRVLPPPPENTKNKEKEIDNLLDELLEKPHNKAGKAYLGIRAIPIPKAIREKENLPQGQGVLVSTVVEGSPAAKSHIQKWDILLAIENTFISSEHEMMQVISRFKPGDKVRLVLFSDGQKKELYIVLGCN
jgi:C-terminal processing protease CtpA/Prc